MLKQNYLDLFANADKIVNLAIYLNSVVLLHEIYADI